MSSGFEDDTDEIWLRVAIGVQADEWFYTIPGKYVLLKAKAEVEAAQAELLDADPTDAALIRKLQNRANVARWGISWLNAAIQESQQLRAEPEG